MPERRTDLALEAAQAVTAAAGLAGVEQTERTEDGVTVTVGICAPRRRRRRWASPWDGT